MSRTRSGVKCAACKRRIPTHEPDVMLRRLDLEHVRYYHTRCTDSALALATEAPQVWLMTVRHVEVEAN